MEVHGTKMLCLFDNKSAIYDKVVNYIAMNLYKVIKCEVSAISLDSNNTSREKQGSLPLLCYNSYSYTATIAVATFFNPCYA